MRKYKYVGSAELLDLVGTSRTRKLVKNASDVLQWLKHTDQNLDIDKEITVTFVITEDENLWIADRYSEHIVCADGGIVLAAGELTFHVDANAVSVVGATNQSTGFCPESDSWQAVAEALDKSLIERPSGYTENFIFRRCENCKMINLVKDNYFVCAVCDNLLTENWNFE